MKVLPLLIVTSLGIGAANAAQSFVTPTGVTQTQATAFPGFPAVNMINGFGLSATPTFANYNTVTHGTASGTGWTTNNPNGAGDYFLASNPGPQAIMLLTLGATYDLSDFVLWGYYFTGPNDNEARAFTLDFSTDGGATFPSSVNIENPLDSHAAANAVTLSLGGVFQADTVRMTVTDNHFGSATPDGGDRLGIGEIGFIAVPEPSAALLVGLCSLGLLRRRR